MLYKKTPERDLSDLKIELDKKNQIKTEYWNKTKLFIISEINKEVDDIKGFAILEELISENKLNNLRPVLEELGFEKAKDKGFNSFLDYKIKKLENRVLLEMENE
jgi:tagatose-1,6-bisphosphate aldolase